MAACAAAGEVVATDVAACDFSYAANPSATQANGFVSLFLQLARDGERVSLSYGVATAYDREGMDAAFKLADERMYEEKKRKHAERVR